MLTQHIQESLQVTPGPFPDFWVGPGDEATADTSRRWPHPPVHLFAASTATAVCWPGTEQYKH